MPKSCCVVDCTNNVQNHPEVKYYMLPTNTKCRKSWLDAINRAKACTKSSEP